MTRRLVALASTLLPLLLLPACSDDEGTKSSNDQGTMTLEFEYTVGAAALELGSTDYLYTNAAGNQYKVVELQHYVCNVVLRRADNSTFEARDVHLLDASKPTSLSFTVQHIPPGEYAAIEFVAGVDDERNVAGGLPNTVDNLNMEWPAQLGGGYHNLRMTGHYEGPTGADSTWTAHVGKMRHGAGDPHYHNHVATVTLPGSSMNFDNDAWVVRVRMDVNSWFDTPTVYDFLEFGSYVMENHEAQEALVENAADAFSVVSKERQ